VVHGCPDAHAEAFGEVKGSTVEARRVTRDDDADDDRAQRPEGGEQGQPRKDAKGGQDGVTADV
jgi:hypothetical protein